MGYRKIETTADLDAALKAWARWKARGDGGYPSMDTIARVREACLGGTFGPRLPPQVDMPWGVELCVQGMAWMAQTKTGSVNVYALRCHYLGCHVRIEDRIKYLQDRLREATGDPGLKVGQRQYYVRVASAKEQLLDWIQRQRRVSASAGADNI